MTEKEFIVWLHGYLEISGAKTLGEKELQVIRDHLDKFFVKVTPDRSTPTDIPDSPGINLPHVTWPQPSTTPLPYIYTVTLYSNSAFPTLALG